MQQSNLTVRNAVSRGEAVELGLMGKLMDAIACGVVEPIASRSNCKSIWLVVLSIPTV
jgi:hypothetical protein